MPLGSELPYLRGVSNPAQTTAGTTQATAAPMLADHVSVASAVEGSGLILPDANASDMFTVANKDQLNGFFVYPPVGASFNGLTANLPLALAPACAAFFIFASPTDVICIFS